jgi:hypothetical protein
MRTGLLCILATGFGALWSQDPQPSALQKRAYPVQLGSGLNASSQSELNRRLSAAFTEGTAHPDGVNNCSDWLARRRRLPASEATGPDAQAQKSTLVDCLVLQELRSAAAARSSHVADLNWDEHLMPLLPPQLAITVSDEAVRAAKAAAARGRAWADVDKTATASADGSDRIVVKGDGFVERLILWGRGDFNRDGRQDLLVQSVDRLTEGTYRNMRLFVLTRRNANGKLSVVRQLL